MSGTSGSPTIAVPTMHIAVTTPFHLNHTNPPASTLLHGNYVAIQQSGSHPLAYDLYKADANWVRDTVKFANVFIEIVGGVVRIR